MIEGTGNAVASSGDHYEYSNSGSLDVGSEEDPSYSGLGTYSVSDDYSASGARDVSSTVSTDYALNAGATWIASNTNTSVTGFGNATYSNSDHYFNQSGSNPNGNSTSDFFQSETVNYHYKQNPNHAISGNGTSTISGNGTMTASATGTQSSTVTTNSVMNYTTLSDSTVTQNDVYSEGAHWSETYGTSGLSRTDPVDDGPGGNATTLTHTVDSLGYSHDYSPDPRLVTQNILTNGSPWSGDGGMDMGTAMPQPSTITPNTDPVGTMPNFADPNGVPAQVTGALATASAPGAGSLSNAFTPPSITPLIPPAPVQAPAPTPAPTSAPPPQSPPAPPAHWWQNIGSAIRAAVNFEANTAAQEVTAVATAAGFSEETVKETAAFARGAVEGASQGIANVLNGVQDAAVSTANLAVKLTNPTMVAASLAGVDTDIPSPDWSKGLITEETERAHFWSKVLGGQGAITLATLGFSATGQAAGASEAATSNVLKILNPEFTPSSASLPKLFQGIVNQTLARLTGSVSEMEAAQEAGDLEQLAGGFSPRAIFGNILEREVAKDIAGSALHRQLFLWLKSVSELANGGVSTVGDFAGIGPAAGDAFELTTVASEAAHAARWQGLFGQLVYIATYTFPF